MHMNDYQSAAMRTAIYPPGLTYPVLGLVGEAGEVANKVKKIIRDDHGILSDSRREELIDEISDVAWYLAAIAHELGVGLDDVAQRNLDKLASRQARGTLGGSGDMR